MVAPIDLLPPLIGYLSVPFVFLLRFKIFTDVLDLCVDVLSLLLVKRTHGIIGLDSEEAISRGDGYIDRILQYMFEDKVEEYDPYKIEDSVVGFNRKIAFVNVSGEAKLHDGYIAGLKTLARADHCSLEKEFGRLNVKADLGAGILQFHYSGSVKFMNFGPTITVTGELGYVEVHIEFSVDSETGKNGNLDKFVIDEMRGMTVKVTGLGPLNWAVNPIVSGITKIFKRFLRNFLERKVQNHIAENIKNFQFPVEGISTPEPDETPADTTEPEVTDETPADTTEPEVTDETQTVPKVIEETETEPVVTEPTEPTTEQPTGVEITETTATETDFATEETDLPYETLSPSEESSTDDASEVEALVAQDSDIKYADED